MEEHWTVLIADDEPLVRRGLRKSLEGHPHFLVIGEAANGREAVEIVKSSRPSLVILDVRMPVMDGLKALEQIRSFVPDTLAIMLSGYSDFSYVQRALELGAHDYLLKPADPRSLRGALRRAKTRLDATRQQRDQEQRVSAALSMSLSAYAERFYGQLMAGELPVDEFHQQRRFLEIADGDVAVVLVSLDDAFTLEAERSDFGEIGHAIRSSFEEALRKLLERAPPVLELEAGTYAAVVPCARPPEFEDFADGIARSAREASSRAVTVAVGSVVPLLQAKSSYEVARARLDARFVLGGGRAILETPEEVHIQVEVSSEQRRRMQQALRFGDVAQYNLCLNELFTDFGSKFPSRQSWQFLALSLWQQGNELKRELGIRDDECARLLRVGRELEKLTTVSDIKAWISRRMRGIIADISGDSSGKSIAAKKAMAYIADHFTEDIGLTDVAAAVNLTPNYISQVIRQETGKNFLAHLALFRIEASKELLAAGKLNVSEIAFKVGFNDPRHFSKLFKRLQGMTPGRFRKGPRESLMQNLADR